MQRHLHLNLPTSPNPQNEESKVTDMSLGSEGSSSKTPGFEGFNRHKSFINETLEEEEIPSHQHAAVVMKRSVSSTLDEEEDDDDLLDDECLSRRSGRKSKNNNNDYQHESSDDNLLESLDRKVCQLWNGGKNGNGRRRPTHGCCHCHCHCSSCHYTPRDIPNGNSLSLAAAVRNKDLTEEEEEEYDEDGSEERKPPEGTEDTVRHVFDGRAESNETLDSRGTSSREDLNDYGNDFDTYSDEEENGERIDRNYCVIKRRW